jgi:hypothetical protein
MDLAEHQKALLKLIHDDSSTEGLSNPYLRQVAASKGLQVVREIVARWQAYDVRRSCPLTATALDCCGCLEQVAREARFELADAFLDSRSRLFLDHVGRRGGIIGSVALFERALIDIRCGEREPRVVEWDQDPTAIINGLIAGRWLDGHAKGGAYRTVIDPTLPELVRIDVVE